MTMTSDEGEGERGRGVQTRDETRRTENRERRTEKDGRGAAGSRVVYTVGDHTEMRGNETAVAFYPDLLI